MRFRPCIDVHNGQVKQIVGGSLKDKGDRAVENFVSLQGGEFYGNLYKQKGLEGGHVILLNGKDSPYYEVTKKEGMKALSAFFGGLQIGGGITADNAKEFLEAGASHVIVTSYVFKDGEISFENLEKMRKRVGKEHLVLDLSCRKREDAYYIVTDRWQRFTNVKVDEKSISLLSSYCDEFLVHGVDVEGKSSGIETDLVKILAKNRPLPVTYAGGVSDFSDLQKLRDMGKNSLDVTIGSALDLFGGSMSFEEVLDFCRESKKY